MQMVIFILLYFSLPAYPAKNPPSKTNFVVTYAKLLWSIITLLFKEPLLVQSCAIGLCAASTFTSFWTTLTFLLSSPPFNYSPLIIGLFALIGIASLLMGPLYSRIIIDRFNTHFSVMLGLFIVMTGVLVGLFVAPINVAGSVIQAFMLDMGLQSSQIANRAAIYTLDPKARNRVNTAFMLSVFFGQIIGTAVGNAVYARKGWKGADAVSAGFIGLGLIFWAAKGPKETSWIGWGGGWTIKRPEEQAEEKNSSQAESDDTERATKKDEADDASETKNSSEDKKSIEQDGTSKS